MTLRSPQPVVAKVGGGDEDSSIAFPSPKSAASESSPPEPLQLHPEGIIPVVHRRTNPNRKGPDVFRAVFDVPFSGGRPHLEGFRAVLTTPDARAKWDALVESSEMIEMPDSTTRISKTNYRLGWPASPRDAITVSRVLDDGATLVDLSASLPSSPDAPAYLRPAPPYVRSHVHLAAWCIQLPAALSKGKQGSNKIKISAYWSWDLKGAWLGLPAGGLGNQLQLMVRRLVDFVATSSIHIPSVRFFGAGVDVEHASFDTTRDTLAVDYSVFAESAASSSSAKPGGSAEETSLDRTVGIDVPLNEGWDVKVKARLHSSAGKTVNSDDWTASLTRSAESPSIQLQVSHRPLADLEDVVRISVTIQRVAVSSEVRVNGEVVEIEEKQAFRPQVEAGRKVLQDTASISDLTLASVSTQGSSISSQSTAGTSTIETAAKANGGPAGKIDSLIRRNYIYFTSLLQEPEAKWKRVSDSRGVTITQLDSIDPTLVIYRAEATFVGIGVWDLFSTINSPGARQQWDKGLEESQLLKDVNDLSSLWWNKTKAVWPVR